MVRQDHMDAEGAWHFIHLARETTEEIVDEIIRDQAVSAQSLAAHLAAMFMTGAELALRCARHDPSTVEPFLRTMEVIISEDHPEYNPEMSESLFVEEVPYFFGGSPGL